MQQSETKTEIRALTITSKAFRTNEAIPSRYTCEGDDINPPLDIKEIPKASKSLALIVEDPDAPSGTWLHWLVWNIPVTHHIQENEVRGYQGLNDLGRSCYGGPCPPSETHRYFFKVYALDDLLDLREGSDRKDVEDAMRGHIVAYGDLVGIYKRSPYH